MPAEPQVAGLVVQPPPRRRILIAEVGVERIDQGVTEFQGIEVPDRDDELDVAVGVVRAARYVDGYGRGRQE